jgi:APA family basic amino acid/polyamine antiporter
MKARISRRKYGEPMHRRILWPPHHPHGRFMTVDTRAAVETDQGNFVRAITRVGAVALVAGSMIGAGIFIVPADMMRTVQSPGLFLLGWVLGGVITLAGALTFSELAGMFPRAGGLYVYLREGISAPFGFLYGWTLFTVIWSGGIAAASVGFARFAAVLAPGITPDVFLGQTVHFAGGPITIGLSPQRILAVAAIVFLTWINIRGVARAARIQTAFTGVKVLAIAAIVFFGLTIRRDPAAVSMNFGAGFWPADGLTTARLLALAASLVAPIFAMDGWYSAAFAAGEFKDPRRDLPFALTAGVSLVALLFLLTNLAYLSVLPAEAIANAPQDRVGTAALEAMFGDAGLYVMASIVTVSVFGLNNGLLLGGARIYYAMARDGLFFRTAGELHSRYRTPAFALVLQAVWISVLCLSGTYSQLVDYVTFASVLFWALTGIGLFVLRVRRPDAERPVRAWGYPWLPGLFVVASLAIAANLLIQRPQNTVPGLIIVALGIPVYFWQRRGAAR